ncbi:hypothetical protein F2Q69_00056314 [Brassica cretica]|uniref:Exostosin GT47 domain-containing protein n=1 Tax=Brassica cretica TaxID=69181 RepID=A0A8S9MXN5_BRACR|nr:hypothetical protein F2Q69_00056314 [Brassica cretica]
MDKHQYTRFCFLSICVGSIALVFAISRCSISFFDYSLQKLEFSFPESELRRSFYNAGDENRAVDSRDVVSQQILSVRSRNATLRSKPEKKNKLNRRRTVEVGLSKARASIREAASSNRNATLFSVDLPNAQVYRNPSALSQSYLEMEKRFKVYVYEEGEPPLVHDGPCKSVYAVEGRFIMEMEKSRTKFRTYDPDQAHVYFLPFSVTWLVSYLYEYNFDVEPLRTFASDYIRLISSKHPFWNRTSGADHFMLACHDWAVQFNSATGLRSYLEMEKRFKVYVYEEGEPPLVHDGPCKSVYAVEGRFIMEMEKSRTKFRTYDPDQAHVYFLPFSVTWLVSYLYEYNFDVEPLRTFASDYIRLISSKHPFWNRTSGADHFMLACHDWGPLTSKANEDLFNKSIRVMCNANSSEGFNHAKDATLPEIKLYGGEVHPQLRLSKTLMTSPRPHLAFFAGGVHGPVRPILLDHWKQRDPDMPVFEYLPKHLNYYDFMRSSKFCFCPSGYEVASPRLIEAIYSECIPVILSVNFVLPFSDILRWETFSVQVDVSEIPRLKEILMSISDEKYQSLKRNLRYVRRHFELNDPPKRYDAFHMTLHSIWLRRLNLRLT